MFKRRAQGIAATLVALAIAKGLSIIGCTSLPGDCPDRLRCAEPSSSQETSGGSASAGAVDLDSGSGCVPSADGSMMRDGCGVFVRRSGNDGNAGSKAAPVATIARAVELAQKGPMRVYACAETFPETLSLSAKIEIYGGLECGADWVYTGGAKTTLSPTKGVPLILRGTAGGARIFDFAIVAPDGAAPGDSSVAVIASGVKATLTRCSLIAGVGADGAPGSTAPAMPAAGGKAGGPGGVACGAGVVAGGPGASNVCGAMTSSGGAGGAGMHNAGDAGVAGLPGIGQGTGGSGDTGAAMWTCAGSGGDGMDGASGSDGAAGSAGSGLGLISVLGYEGGRGGDGKGGAPGQGGGGGGGRVGTGVCSMGKGGAAGGGGGAGGCGGAAGGGGMAGGASIALLSLQSTLTLASVVLVAGNGGRGGDGGASQVGGVGGGGGVGGTGVNGGCHGGRGGDGGKGGFGGGGAGGHTIGLAYTGAPPSIDDGWISVGVAGMGGASMGNPGSSGVAAKQQKFQ